jgi:hypothetical protein
MERCTYANLKSHDDRKMTWALLLDCKNTEILGRPETNVNNEGIQYYSKDAAIIDHIFRINRFDDT